MIMDIKVGQLLRCKNGERNYLDTAWIVDGDVVRVKEIYPHHILVEKVKPGKYGTHMRQCFCRNGIELDLQGI